MDGWVTCLRASDGELVWRFFAGRAERLVSVHGRLESLWPVHGSPVVQNEELYVAAGRNSFLDGGIALYKLDPLTGRVLAQNVVSNVDPISGEQVGRSTLCDMDGCSDDVLSGDGTNVYMKHLCFGADLEQLPEYVPHLFATHGFLEDEWFIRSYWLLGTDVRAGWAGWASACRETVFGRILCYDESNVYGYGRIGISGSRMSQWEDAYHLFRAPKVLRTTTGSFDKLPKGRKPGPRPTPVWSDPDSLIVHGMALTPGVVIVAGAVDRRVRQGDLLAYEDGDVAMASIKGDYGVRLRLVSAEDGSVVSEERLDAMPVHDGLSAANGSVFISLKNGAVERWSD
jgi:hypothetical protein